MDIALTAFAIFVFLVVFSNVAHFTIGAYVFEFLGSLEFEYQVLTGQRTFRAPMLVRPSRLDPRRRHRRTTYFSARLQLYFYCKWALLAALAGM